MTTAYKIATFIISACLLEGCAHTCSTQTYYKPIVNVKEASYGYKNGKVLVDIAPGLSTEFLECGTAYRGAGGEPAFACLVIFIQEGHSLVFRTTTATIKVGSAPSVNIELQRRAPEKDLLGIMLPGGINNECGIFSRGLAGAYCWREYSTSIRLPIISASQFEVDFPAAYIDGKFIKIPNVLFKRVTDEQCQLSV